VDARLREPLAGARVRIRADGRNAEGSWVSSAAADAPAVPADKPALQPDETREAAEDRPMPTDVGLPPSSPAGESPGRTPLGMGPAPRHGGRTFSIQGGSLEVVREGDRFTVYSFDPAGSPLQLAQPPSLVLADQRTVALEPVPGMNGAWRSSTLALQGANPSHLSITIDGRAQKLALADPQAPGLQSGVLQFPGGPSLRVLCDETRGLVKLEPMSPRDAHAITSPPEVLVGTGANQRSIAVRAVGTNGEAQWHVQAAELFRPGAGARVRLNVDGRPLVASLTQVAPERGSNGGMIVHFSGETSPFEVLHDRAAGRVTVFSVGRNTPCAVPAAPTIALTTPTGMRELRLQASGPGTWTLTSPDLRQDLNGSLKFAAGERTFEAPLPNHGSASAANAEPAAADAADREEDRPSGQAPSDAGSTPSGNR
jgi:hypothetical protein